VRLFLRKDEKQFSRPATGAFLVKNDALCEAGGEGYFYSFFGGFLKPPKNGLFFSGLTAHVV